jgi:magnesium-transporting ATPase (P-type)
VPVDGEIVEGRSSLDESMVTGESMPVSKEVGGKVIAGTLNSSGGFVTLRGRPRPARLNSGMKVGHRTRSQMGHFPDSSAAAKEGTLFGSPRRRAIAASRSL